MSHNKLANTVQNLIGFTGVQCFSNRLCGFSVHADIVCHQGCAVFRHVHCCSQFFQFLIPRSVPFGFLGFRPFFLGHAFVQLLLKFFRIVLVFTRISRCFSNRLPKLTVFSFKSLCPRFPINLIGARFITGLVGIHRFICHFIFSPFCKFYIPTSLPVCAIRPFSLTGFFNVLYCTM